MSVIITGMEMPYRCDECPLVTDNECPLLGIDVDEEECSRDLRCPLKDEDNEVVTHAIKKGTPHETVTEFADRCRECGRERVLDKIRAEIEELEEGITSYHNDRPWIFKDEVLTIIDKYKAESEE